MASAQISRKIVFLDCGAHAWNLTAVCYRWELTSVRIRRDGEKVEYSRLGNAFEVSRLTLGTVELGLDYGFRGSAHYQKPDPNEAVRIVHCALDLGVNLIDTARGYGSSEELIGRALRKRSGAAPLIASKVVIPERQADDPGSMQRAIRDSVETSLRFLRIETIDLLHIHNTSLSILADEEVLRILENLRHEGKVRFLGVSCDDEDVCLAALEKSSFRSIQTPFNLLNQRLLSNVAPLAAQRGVGILVRSAFLRGILTDSVAETPTQLSDLKSAALDIWSQFEGEVGSLSELALRFCLSFPEVSSVVVGVRSVAEMEANARDADRGKLSASQIQKLRKAGPANHVPADPRKWQELI